MPSRTALGAAAHRAVHQVRERGAIFADPLAVPIVGEALEKALLDDEADPARGRLRLFIAVRSRFAEDALEAAVARGVRQLVVLGAGLDTYAYRTRLGDRLRIFEVDHPATQAWKRARLAELGIAVPAALTFAPVNFEHDTLGAGLAAAGFDPNAPSFFTWLGVVPYLTESAVFATLRTIAALPGGSHVVFDYGNPPAPDEESREALALRAALAARVAAVGEEFRSYFETAELHARLRALGFVTIEDLGRTAIAERYFGGAPSGGSDRGGHIVRASTIA